MGAGRNACLSSSQTKLKRMKVLNGILSVLSGITALYLMFIKAESNQDLAIGFIMLLMSVIFILFMIVEEQKEDIEQLRRQLHERYNNKMHFKGGYGDESPAEYQRMLREVR